MLEINIYRHNFFCSILRTTFSKILTSIWGAGRCALRLLATLMNWSADFWANKIGSNSLNGLLHNRHQCNVEQCSTHAHILMSVYTYIHMYVSVCIWNGQCQSIVLEIRQSSQQHMITAGIANIQFNRLPVDIFRINNAHSLMPSTLCAWLQRYNHARPIRRAIKSSISLHFGQSPFMKLLMCATYPSSNWQPPIFLV